MKTIIEVLNSGTDYLKKNGCDEARSIMQHLMAHVLGCDRTYLYTHFDRPLDEAVLTPLRDLLKRKANGEPLQHLLGSVEFFRREFLSDKRALIPRPETEELVELVLQKARSMANGLNILDMGCGSGIIGISLALELGDKINQTVLADVSPSALALALENAIRLGAKVSTIESDLFSAFAEKRKEQGTEERFDLIVANLPYIPNGEDLQQEVHFDPSSALYGGESGWEIIERFLLEARDFLTDGGMVALEIGYDQEQPVRDLLSSVGYSDILFERDMNGIPRFPFATYSPRPTHHESGKDTD